MYVTTNRTGKIASIIEKRRPLIEKIEVVEANLHLLSSKLHHLENYRHHLLTAVNDQNVYGRLQEIDLTTIQNSIADELNKLAKLKMRFCRDTLNIGVVGRARQGKSRLLQSLTGLTAAEIPDGDRQHCTGVRSTIHHNPNVDTYGEVWFHSERSFLDEVISPYYQKLHLGNTPITIEEFATNPLPKLPQNLPGYAEPGAMYEHLTRYHTHLDKYRHLLQNLLPRRISRDEIREYVAQDTPDGKRVFFNYLAVREVKIVCNFPNADVGQIALVDMPGLGDTGVGDEERLMKTLGQDVDAVLFVRMPKSSGDYWADVDVRLYDTSRAALVDLPINLWSFMVLNQTAANSKNGDNSHNCQDLAETLTDKHLQVVDCLIANCADNLAANQVLDQVLDYLVINITSLDQQYGSSRQERLIQLQNSVEAELEKARNALGQSTPQDNWFPVFEQLFNQLWNDLTSGLERLLRQLRQQRNADDIDFKQQVEAAIQACRHDTGIPSLEQIEKRRDRIGGYPNAYYQYLNEIRAHLSQNFLLLDEALKRSLSQLKANVAQVLIEQGRLGKLTNGKKDEFFPEITNLIPENLSKLKLGFHILSDFDISYRGLIQHRIRKHLDGLTPDDTSLQLSKSPSAKELLANLKALQAEAIYGCETALEDLLCEPSQAAFAIVEEFIDRVLRAEGAKIEWRIFLEEMRAEIWQEEFEQLGERTKLRREWLNSIEQAATANKSDSIKFLN
ncbi:hypothetical protein H6G06_12735 [Anabaena sphaerica FACHB-251]|uniref:Dynamin family protein n=1 Tax=Anabaena sphaerica FACHB-251 TaxID=2692883 RepID=A0A926WJI9_9NOST|nr:hypothetical protein [Anabaena sphaerica]MBD2294328.1 hypothetical protein [Anabaena sphaerica FACHB-251]